MFASAQKTKGLRPHPPTLIRIHLADIIPNDAAYPHWKQLCLAAVSELDPTKLPRRLADARSAVLDRIEDRFSKPSDGEQTALRDASEMLSMLRTIAEREIGEQKTGT